MKFSIASKLATLCGILVLALGILAVSAFIQSGKLEEHLLQITEVDEPASKSSLEMDIHALAAGHAVSQFMHDFNKIHLAQFEEEVSNFERMHLAYQSVEDNAETQQLGIKAKENFDRFRIIGDELMQLASREVTLMTAFDQSHERLRNLLNRGARTSSAVGETEDPRKRELALKFEVHAATIAASVAKALKFHDTVHKDKVLSEEAEFGRLLTEYNGLQLTAGEEQWASQVQDIHKEAVKQAADILEVDLSMDAKIALMEQARKDFHEVLSGQIQATVHADLEKAKEDANSGMIALQATVIGVACGGILIGLLAALGISKSILGSIKHLMEGVRVLGTGNLKHRIQRSSRDELGDLSDGFNGMAESLDDQQLAICDAIVQLQSISVEILASTNQQASGMEEQNASVTETVSTMKELGQTAAEAAERAGVVRDVIARAAEVGDTGRAAVERSVAAMDKVRQQVNSIAEDNLGLAERAQAIGDIIATVNDVTDQTNLLALNAAVEAARAGEYGKGFGVVAAEIKTLAEQSREATRQVSQILGDIQKATNAAVLATEQGTRDADEATQVVQEAGQTIAQLSSSLEETSMMATQISASAGQQAIGVKQVNEAMGHLEMVAREQVAATRQVEAAMENLQSLSNELGKLVGQGGSRNDSSWQSPGSSPSTGRSKRTQAEDLVLSR